MTRAVDDTWAAGDAYEPFIGRWSRRVARDFVGWLGLPPGGRWLDVGCGTGALTEAILDGAAPAAVTGVDPSAGFVGYARRRVADARARFVVGDARALPVAEGGVDAAVSGLVVNFVAEPERAVAEMRRATRAGGCVAAYVWDYAGEMQLLRRFWDAAVALDPGAAPLDEGRRFPGCHPAALSALFEGAGLVDVAVRAIDVATVFADLDDLWAPFLGGQGPAPGYVSSRDDAQRAALRERLRRGLPIDADGQIRLIARAWAVRAVAP